MSDAIQHIKMIHDLAAGIDGKMILASYGEDSAGKKITPKVQHFKIGQYEAMAKRAKEWSQEQGRNVYMPLPFHGW